MIFRLTPELLHYIIASFVGNFDNVCKVLTCMSQESNTVFSTLLFSFGEKNKNKKQIGYSVINEIVCYDEMNMLCDFNTWKIRLKAFEKIGKVSAMDYFYKNNMMSHDFVVGGLSMILGHVDIVRFAIEKKAIDKFTCSILKQYGKEEEGGEKQDDDDLQRIDTQKVTMELRNTLFNETSTEIDSIMHCAIVKDCPDVVEYLLMEFTNWDIPHLMNTEAIEHGNLEIIKLLYHTGNYTWTEYDSSCCVMNNHDDVIDWIIASNLPISDETLTYWYET